MNETSMSGSQFMGGLRNASQVFVVFLSMLIVKDAQPVGLIEMTEIDVA